MRASFARPALVILVSVAIWPLSFLFRDPESDAPGGYLFQGTWTTYVAIVLIGISVLGIFAGLVWLFGAVIYWWAKKAMPDIDQGGENP